VQDELVCALSTHKTHLSLPFFQGQRLPPARGPLEGSGTAPPGLRCRLHQTLDPVQIGMLVSAAARLARQDAAQRPPRCLRPSAAPWSR
jgi:hypothetical protein